MRFPGRRPSPPITGMIQAVGQAMEKIRQEINRAG